MMHCNLNLDHPVLFTEKQQWLKIYDSTALKTFCTDKITIHSYVVSKLGKDICIPIINVYNSPEEIRLEDLPNQFVIKCNHGCKMNIVVKDKNSFDFEGAKSKLRKWLSIDFSQANGCELHYKNIPHKILIEVYKENKGHSDLTDYKFYCFNGKPLFCQVITDRHTHILLSHYDMDWNYAPQYDWVEYKSTNTISKPQQFEYMKLLCEKLSNDFKLCRCDFYEIDGVVYLGELTFTPTSGFHHFKEKGMNKKLGELLRL